MTAPLTSAVLTVTAARRIKVSGHVSPKQITEGSRTTGGASLTRRSPSLHSRGALEPASTRTPSHCKQFSAASTLAGASSYAGVPLSSRTPNRGRAMITGPARPTLSCTLSRHAKTRVKSEWQCWRCCRRTRGLSCAERHANKQTVLFDVCSDFFDFSPLQNFRHGLFSVLFY